MKKEKVTKIFVGLFEIKVSDELTIETILAGVRNGEYRATIEHEESAVPSLITLCNELATSQNLKWRLVKCSNIEEINLKDYDEINHADFVNVGGVLWNP